MATAEISTPAAPSILPEKVKAIWTKRYTEAFEQAQLDHPDKESTQRAVARKSANAVLAVPAPKSAGDIDKLEAWQVLHRGERDGVKFCVTIDGRKYKHPLKKANEQEPQK